MLSKKRKNVNNFVFLIPGPPGEPAGVYAIKGTATPYSISLTWTKPAERGSAITNYTIEAMTTFNPIWRKVGGLYQNNNKLFHFV